MVEPLDEGQLDRSRPRPVRSQPGLRRDHDGRRVAAGVAALLAMLVMPSGTLHAQDSDRLLSPGDLKKLSIEELLDVSVTLVSKRPEKLSEAPSAIQVITSEDIRRSGATHLGDVLRLVSNVEVQQINSYAWVVSTRGFDQLFSNKLLVMIDGRTVYSPLDAGVFWDAQGILLEDIERIEVVSGPRGTLWGSNAVNGVINIISKRSNETQGAYVAGGGGSFLEGFGAARFGGSIGTQSFYRVYAQRYDRNGTLLPNGDEGNNSWKATQGGFRWDCYSPSETNLLTIQGDSYVGIEYNSPTGRSTIDGQNILARWSHTFFEESAVDLQVYADRTWRRDAPSTFSEQLLTYDADLQHHFPIGQRHHVLWGVGARFMEDDAPTATSFVGFLPVRRSMRLYSGFIQEKMNLVPGRLTWTLGAKLEHTEYSGFEFQPSTRLAWTPADGHTVWAAVSRAVRAPSRIDRDYYIPKTPPFAIAGGPDFQSETVVATEAGYRMRPFQSLSLSIASYYNSYDDLHSVELENPPAALPYTIQNGAAGQSWGVELSGLYQASPWWRVRGGYTLFQKDLWSQPGHDVMEVVLASLGNDPQNQAVLQSMMSLGAHVQCDATLRYVDRLPNPVVPSYVAVDLHLAALMGHWELAVVGQNLTDKMHPEFNANQEVPRSVYGSITSRW